MPLKNATTTLNRTFVCRSTTYGQLYP